MNKSDLVHEVSVKTQVPHKEVQMVLDAFIEVATEKLTAGEEVKLPPLGIFKLADRKARQAKNMHTGEIITVPARKAVRFSPSAGLKRGLVHES